MSWWLCLTLLVGVAFAIGVTSRDLASLWQLSAEVRKDAARLCRACGDPSAGAEMCQRCFVAIEMEVAEVLEPRIAERFIALEPELAPEALVVAMEPAPTWSKVPVAAAAAKLYSATTTLREVEAEHPGIGPSALERAIDRLQLRAALPTHCRWCAGTLFHASAARKSICGTCGRVFLWEHLVDAGGRAAG